ncbi:hypothetical protein GAS19_11530 [Burkholderia glumae]|uniref:hypothetical protein n=1 Tax=Burkholderia glumae TaxID=337 RepID=UPI001296BEE9|nr:hypothetical protein [Burkholderia glumae]QGA38183.1 hypothetical protein GAS19_11530 [Burkholderia glumae]
MAANAHNAANAIQSTHARDSFHARPELRLSTAEFSLPRDEPVFGAKFTEIQAIRAINFFANESANMTPVVRTELVFISIAEAYTAPCP